MRDRRFFASQAASAFIKIRTATEELLTIGMALLLAACGGSHHSHTDATPPTYSISGSISGLSAAGLVLQNNAADNLTVAANASSFQFTMPVSAGGNYNVTVATQPTGLICTVGQGAGVNITAAVINISVVCNASTHTIAGTINGLITGGLVLRNNGADDLTLAANAATFQFATPIAAGGGYSVTPFAQPTGLTCTINNGVGSNVNANINNIHIVCSTTTLAVGGTISGLTGSGLVLQNNSGDDLTIPNNATSFEFATPVAYGGGYAISVLTQPSGQYCAIANDSGTASTQITDVALTCSQTSLTSSVAALALTVNCPAAGGSCIYSHAALSGNARQITITNNGSIAATNVSVMPSGLPAGTAISSNTCAGTLAAAASCAITITPGQSENSACSSGIAPTPSTITVSADDAPTTTINAVVLTFGCIYQQGFIYSLDDTTPLTGSIGGKTAALTDTIPGATNPASGTPDWGVSGIDLGPTSYESSPQGANDGSANSATIISAFTTNYTAPPYNGASPVPLSNYAAGLCSTQSVDSAGNMPCTTGTCYTDWHLPAVCELGAFGSCTSSMNMQQQLFEATPAITTLGFVDNAFYWSSTAWSTVPGWAVWVEYFSSGGSGLGLYNRDFQMGVRCSRVMTQ